MSTPITSLPIIEGGSAGDGFLARAVAPMPSTAPTTTTTTGTEVFRETRCLHPLPAGVASAELLDRLRDSIRAMLKEARDDWSAISVMGVANSPFPDSESIRPTVIIMVNPEVTKVERAKAIVGEVIDIQQRLEMDPILSVEVVGAVVANYAMGGGGFCLF